MLADKVTLTTFETLMVCLIGIAVVLLELALIAVLISFISKGVRAFRKKSAPAINTAETPAAEVSDDSLTLENTDESTAAMIMAIVSDESGIPVERLRFKSIRLVDEESKK